MADFSIKAHDVLPTLRVQFITEENQLPVDLTSADFVHFIMVPAVGASPKVKALAEIEIPRTNGIVRYDWLTGDTNLPGEYLGEWQVTWVGGKKQTFPTGTYHSIDVLADLDGV